MNRNSFINTPPKPKCHEGGYTFSRFDKCVRGSNKTIICLNCRNDLVKRANQAASNSRKRIASKGQIAEIWSKKKDAPSIFPPVIFIDGRDVLDMDTHEYVNMKMVDILKYYSKADHA